MVERSRGSAPETEGLRSEIHPELARPFHALKRFPSA